MPSLREIKDRIGSVKSTLKITSAMKLVASSKLRKAQKAVETLRPYSEALEEILGEATGRFEGEIRLLSPATVAARGLVNGGAASEAKRWDEQSEVVRGQAAGFSSRPVAIVAVSSNSSLCGGFNANVIKKTLELSRAIGNVEVFPIGRKMAEAVRKSGFKVLEDLSDMVAHPSYDQAAALSKRLANAFEKEQYSEVLLVYNHFVSTARQEVLVESFLSAPSDGGIASAGVPYTPSAPDYSPASGSADSLAETRAALQSPVDSEEIYIIEPGREEVEEALRPKVLSLKIFSMILDSVAAEQAARTVAMQTATDNAQDLLADLTLEYNKGRQQKITAEILDLVAGSAN